MGKRQLRIFQKDLAAALEKLSGKLVQVVLSDGRVVSGVLVNFSSETLSVLDGRRHQHYLPVAGIEEMVVDVEAFY